MNDADEPPSHNFTKMIKNRKKRTVSSLSDEVIREKSGKKSNQI
jgi:hypothetical protein